MNKPAKQSSRPPTFKQKAFAQKYIELEGNGTQAALAVYDTDDSNTAHSIASENLRKPTIQQEIYRLSEKNGLNLDKAMARLSERAVDKDSDKWALPLWFDVTGLKAPQKVENTHKVDFSDAEREELITLRKQSNSQVIDNK